MHRTDNTITQGRSMTSLRLISSILYIVAVALQPLYAAEQKASAPHVVGAKVENACVITSLPEIGVFRQEQANGAFLTAHYPDPRQLPNDYTDCLQVWMEAKGRSEIFMVGRFEGGDVRAIHVPAMNIECTYVGGKLKAGNTRRACPSTTEGVELKTWRK